jgi:hypothetical protein
MAFDPDAFLNDSPQGSTFDPDAFLNETNTKQAIEKREAALGLTGGIGRTMSKEEAKFISQQRMVDRDKLEGKNELLLLNAGQPNQSVGVKGQGVVPRMLAATVGGGFTSGPARVLQDLAVKSGVASPEVVDAIGVQRVAKENPGTVLTGNLVGGLAPAGKVFQGATALGRIGSGAALGGLYGASEEIGEKGLDGVSDNTDELLKRITTSAALGALVPGAVEGIKALSPLASKASQTLKDSAGKDISMALSPTTRELKAKTEKLIPEILKRPFRETYAFTKKGLEQKANSQKELAGEAIDAFGKLEGDVNPSQIVDVLENLKSPYVIEGKVIDPEAIARIDALQDTFRQYGDSISKEGIRQIRRTFDRQISESKGFFKDLNQGSQLNLKKVAANEIRDLIAKDNPDLAALNKQFNFWSNLDDVISATNERIKPQSGLTGNLAAIGGAVSATSIEGMIGRALVGKALVSAIKSPGWKLASARVKSNIANAIAGGNNLKALNSLQSIFQEEARRVAIDRAFQDVPSDAIPAY